MKYYFRIKMLLVTFTLGLVGVWIFADSQTHITDLNSRQPLETIIDVTVENVTEEKNKFGSSGNCGGKTCEEARAEAEREGKPFNSPNCE